MTIIDPIHWWAIYFIDSSGRFVNKIVEYCPGVDQYEARKSMAAKHDKNIHDIIAVEAYGETCCECHRGFLMLASGPYTHAMCDKCCEERGL